MILAVPNIQLPACSLVLSAPLFLCMQVQQIPGSRSRLSLLNTQLRAMLACLSHAKADKHQEAAGMGDCSHAVLSLLTSLARGLACRSCQGALTSILVAYRLK